MILPDNIAVLSAKGEAEVRSCPDKIVSSMYLHQNTLKEVADQNNLT